MEESPKSDQSPVRDLTAIEALEQGAQAFARGDHAAALRSFDLTIRLDPKQADALNNRGAVRAIQGDAEAAARDFEMAISVDPKQPDAHQNLGRVLHSLGRYEAALVAFDRAVELNPQIAAIWQDRGATLKHLGRFEESIPSFDFAIALNPGSADAHYMRAVCFHTLGRFEATAAGLGAALALRPRHVEAQIVLGATYRALNRLEDSLAVLDDVLADHPSEVNALFERSMTLIDFARFDEALAILDAISIQDPAHAEARFNRSLILFAQGDFEVAVDLYEFRFQTEGLNKSLRNYKQPRLKEQSVAGKTVFLYWEQGLGDVIQYSRFATRLAELGARVILEVQEPLVTLLSSLHPGVEVIADGEPIPDFDLHSPLLSLPHTLRVTLDTLPGTRGYIRAEDSRVARWRGRLKGDRLLKVGLAWSGAHYHKRDSHRSLPLAQLSSLFDLPCQFHVVQKEVRTLDQPHLNGLPRLHAHTLHLTDFAETAALMDGLDLVISVDTSTAHLAGALGKPVWILLPYIPDPRWMNDRADSPWYSSAQLFRQGSDGVWPPVIAAVKAALKEFRAP